MPDFDITGNTLITLALILLAFSVLGMIARIGRALLTVVFIGAAVVFIAGLVAP